MLIPFPNFPESIVRIMFADQVVTAIKGTVTEFEAPEGVEIRAVGVGDDGQPVGEPVVVVAAAAPSDPPANDEDEPEDEPEDESDDESLDD